MRVLFTICGRAGSKGIKNKNIRDFVEKPLAYYTLSAIDLFLKRNDEIAYDIVINSDSETLLDMMKENPMRPVELIVRKPDLAGDAVGKIDVISNCMDEMQKRKNVVYDMVVDLDITSPLRKVADIENLIKVHSEKKADVTTSVVPARRNPYFNQVMRTEKGVKKVIASNFTARQQAPEIFDMNASMYAYAPEYLRSGKGVLDGYCEVIEMYDTGILDLDHKNDFELMEVLARYFYEKDEEFKEIRENIK
ncbi:MAG: acylneuraminate cytidylyltransferase family protein [Lachnospiraceae bacterium]|nr:acylneuraminate cytidylyltransferase family protein [Lachnospiraceae bacterium]